MPSTSRVNAVSPRASCCRATHERVSTRGLAAPPWICWATSTASASVNRDIAGQATASGTAVTARDLGVWGCCARRCILAVSFVLTAFSSAVRFLDGPVHRNRARHARVRGPEPYGRAGLKPGGRPRREADERPALAGASATKRGALRTPCPCPSPPFASASRSAPDAPAAGLVLPSAARPMSRANGGEASGRAGQPP